MRCYDCGNKVADGQEECPTCHTALWAIGPTDVNMPAPLAVAAQGDLSVAVTNRGRQDVSLPISNGHMMLQQTGAMVAGAASAAHSALAHALPVKRSVHGRVIMAEAAYTEHPDRDICRFITRALWIALLVCSPVLLLYWIAVRIGGLPALLTFAGLFLLMRFLSPTNLFAMFRMYSLLNPVSRDRAEQVPVRYYRIRETDSDAEVMVRVKGVFTTGNVGMDDLVTLRGLYRRGTLYVRHGYNHRTSSTVSLARSHSWVGLVLTVFILMLLVAAFREPAIQIGHVVNSLGGR